MGEFFDQLGPDGQKAVLALAPSPASISQEVTKRGMALVEEFVKNRVLFGEFSKKEREALAKKMLARPAFYAETIEKHNALQQMRDISTDADDVAGDILTVMGSDQNWSARTNEGKKVAKKKTR